LCPTVTSAGTWLANRKRPPTRTPHRLPAGLVGLRSVPGSG
jgi:hypothetical protein